MTVCGIKHADGVCVMGECPYIKMCCPAVWDKRKSEPQTNEEWLRSCTTEELVGAIYEWHSLGYTRHRIGRKLNPPTEILQWLKEKHE